MVEPLHQCAAGMDGGPGIIESLPRQPTDHEGGTKRGRVRYRDGTRLIFQGN